MTIGDVLAAVAAVIGCGITWTAAVLLTALVFPIRTQRVREAVASSPGACLGRGMGIVVLGGLAAGALNHSPAGLGKLFAVIVLAGLAALAALGSAGIARLISERIQTVGTTLSPFASLACGTSVYAAAGFLPFIGWFLIAPIALLISLGGSVAAPEHEPRHAAISPKAIAESAEATA